jgi:hypothetical protein
MVCVVLPVTSTSHGCWRGTIDGRRRRWLRQLPDLRLSSQEGGSRASERPLGVHRSGCERVSPPDGIPLGSPSRRASGAPMASERARRLMASVLDLCRDLHAHPAGDAGNDVPDEGESSVSLRAPSAASVAARIERATALIRSTVPAPLGVSISVPPRVGDGLGRDTVTAAHRPVSAAPGSGRATDSAVWTTSRCSVTPPRRRAIACRWCVGRSAPSAATSGTRRVAPLRTTASPPSPPITRLAARRTRCRRSTPPSWPGTAPP